MIILVIFIIFGGVWIGWMFLCNILGRFFHLNREFLLFLHDIAYWDITFYLVNLILLIS